MNKREEDELLEQISNQIIDIFAGTLIDNTNTKLTIPSDINHDASSVSTTTSSTHASSNTT